MALMANIYDDLIHELVLDTCYGVHKQEKTQSFTSHARSTLAASVEQDQCSLLRSRVGTSDWRALPYSQLNRLPRLFRFLCTAVLASASMAETWMRAVSL